MKGIILAGGSGSRFYSATMSSTANQARPKARTIRPTRAMSIAPQNWLGQSKSAWPIHVT